MQKFKCTICLFTVEFLNTHHVCFDLFIPELVGHDPFLLVAILTQLECAFSVVLLPPTLGVG